jgi:ribosomal-protein-alanine N-acetyltransferase
MKIDVVPKIDTPRLVLKMIDPSQAESVVRYLVKNKEHLADSGPRYPKEYFNVDYWKVELHDRMQEFRSDRSLKLFLFEKEPNGERTSIDIIGSVNLSEFVRRVSQFCYLGYALDRDFQGKGYMTEAVGAVVKFGFEELNLHRIMANYMPRNERSAAVLKRAGFTIEGQAKDYLFINGKWEDHILTSITNSAWREPA